MEDSSQSSTRDGSAKTSLIEVTMLQDSGRLSVFLRIFTGIGNFIRATWWPYYSQSVFYKDIVEDVVDDQDAQTKEWRDMKLAELNIVSVTGALVASVVTGALAWPIARPWTVTGFWLCALVFALFSVVLATQQSVVLTRASSGHNHLAHIRVLIGASMPPSTTETTARYVPSGTRNYAWQAGTMMVGISIQFLLIGLAVYIYDTARTAGVWGPEIKVAIWFSISIVFGLLTYLVSWRNTEYVFQQLLLASEKERNNI